MDKQARLRFGQMVADRRAELGVSQVDVANAGGAPLCTIDQIEKAEGPEPDNSTLARLDRPLRWKPGSAIKAWAGGDPESLDVAGRGADAPVAVLGAREVTVSMKDLAAVMEAVNMLQSAVDVSDGDSVSADVVTAAAGELSGFVSRSVGVWITDLLECNYGTGREIPPIYMLAFREHLNAPVADDDPDRDDKLYRRWLADLTVPDDMTVARFQRRLAERRADCGSTSAAIL